GKGFWHLIDIRHGLSIDGKGTRTVITDQRSLITFEKRADFTFGSAGYLRRFGRPIHFHVVELEVCVQPLRRVCYPVGSFPTCGDTPKPCWMNRPPHDVRDVAPEIRKHPATVIQEVAVREVTAFRKIID